MIRSLVGCLLCLSAIPVFGQNQADFQRLADAKNKEPVCKVTVYLSTPTQSHTWFVAPTVEDMKVGLYKRRRGEPSSFNVLAFVKDDLCSYTPDFIDNGNDGYVEVVVNGDLSFGSISKASIKKIFSWYWGE